MHARHVLLWTIALLLVLTPAGITFSQVPSPPVAANVAPPVAVDAEEEEEGPLVSDSGAGYIDSAILGNQVRFRYDSAYDNVQPARAEFFWPVDGPFGNGPGPETSIDYQDFAAYIENRLGCRWSVFAELPFRVANPDIQDNTAGLGDMNIGFKYALSECGCQATTFQLRAYLPTGDGDRGLGTDHVSLEPALLHYRRVSARTAWFAELRDWIGFEGTPTFTGNVLRYGLGASYQVNDCDSCQPLRLVGEVVGWTVLNGRSAITTGPAIAPVTTFPDVTGDTIVNAKLGARWRFTSRSDLYCGYGRVLTEQTWYDDVIRFEWRTTY